MAKKKRSRVVGYTVPIRVGDVTIPIRGRTKKAARSKANAFKRHHLKNIKVIKNVESGPWDATGFHPHRSSGDYSSSRAGEGRSRTAAKVRGKRTVRKHLKKSRPMH